MDNAPSALRWGVLGAADIAVPKVIPAIGAGSEGQVEAIASRSESRARDMAGQLGIPKWFGSYQDLLDAPDIDAVYIPLPNHLHLEWTLAAAEAGKHILCEKPLALSSDDARTMIEACDGAGVKLMEAFMYRLHPMWARVRSLVDQGAIGELVAVQSVFAYNNDDPADIRNIAEYGGGALYDIGCYLVNVARMLFDSEPTGIESSVLRDPSSGTDILTSAVLDFDGRHATFSCSTRMDSTQWVNICGTRGQLRVDTPFNIPPDLATTVLQVGMEGAGDPVAHHIDAANQYTVQCDSFARSIREDRPVPTPPQDAVGNLAVIEAILVGG